jgi:DNA-binding response OmpR family regulator
MKRIAVVEDEPEARAWLVAILSARHEATGFPDGVSFLRALVWEDFDLACVDWTLPDMTGGELVDRIRSGVLARTLPVIIVTARNGDEDLVEGLATGADDFMSKPVREPVLAARVDALLRRAAADASDGPDAFGCFVFDRKRQSVRNAHRELILTGKEFTLALLLFRNIDRPLSRTYLMEEVWGAGVTIASRSLDTHVCRLKKKLGLTPSSGFDLGPVYGFGYRLERLTSDGGASAPAAPSA